MRFDECYELSSSSKNYPKAFGTLTITEETSSIYYGNNNDN